MLFFFFIQDLNLKPYLKGTNTKSLKLTKYFYVDWVNNKHIAQKNQDLNLE